MSFSGCTVQERPSPAQCRAFNLDPLQALPLVPRTLPAPKNPPAGHSQWVPEYTRGETAMSPPGPLGACQDQCMSWARPWPLLATHLERATRPVYRAAGLSRPRGRPWTRPAPLQKLPFREATERVLSSFGFLLLQSVFLLCTSQEKPLPPLPGDANPTALRTADAWNKVAPNSRTSALDPHLPGTALSSSSTISVR